MNKKYIYIWKDTWGLKNINTEPYARPYKKVKESGTGNGCNVLVII